MGDGQSKDAAAAAADTAKGITASWWWCCCFLARFCSRSYSSSSIAAASFDCSTAIRAAAATKGFLPCNYNDCSSRSRSSDSIAASTTTTGWCCSFGCWSSLHSSTSWLLLLLLLTAGTLPLNPEATLSRVSHSEAPNEHVALQRASNVDIRTIASAVLLPHPVLKALTTRKLPSANQIVAPPLKNSL